MTKPRPQTVSMDSPLQFRASDVGLAHGLARLALGLNIFAHGLSRIGDIPDFAAAIEKMFAATWIPAAAVTVTAYSIPPIELTVGALLVLGLFLRPALVIGTLLLCQLTFGSALTQQWDIAGIQLVYVAIYTVLLASAGFDHYSIDRLVRRQTLDSATRIPSTQGTREPSDKAVSII
jgi:thiosulfate dehydrogenase (quinone) large subunit